MGFHEYYKGERQGIDIMMALGISVLSEGSQRKGLWLFQRSIRQCLWQNTGHRRQVVWLIDASFSEALSDKHELLYLPYTQSHVNKTSPSSISYGHCRGVLVVVSQHCPTANGLS